MKVIATLKDGKKSRLEIKGETLTDSNGTVQNGATINEVFVILDNKYCGIPYDNFLTYLKSYTVLGD